MRILSLDLATKTGYAYRDDWGKIISGVKDFKVKGKLDPALRFSYLQDWISSSLSPFYRMDKIFYEQPHKSGGKGAEFLIGLVTIVKVWCAEHAVAYDYVHTGTLKKWATGNGHAKKPDMIKRAREILGREPIDDNEADAVCLLLYAEAHNEPSE